MTHAYRDNEAKHTHTHTHNKIVVKAENSSFSLGKKSQSAMEYLMTYGWAVLIIAVVLVALFQMGVFNSANFAPKAQPGSCQVFKTVAATSLEGTCNNELPQYVAQFDGATSTVISTVQSTTLPIFTLSVWVNPTGTNPDSGVMSYGEVLFSASTSITRFCPDTSLYCLGYTYSFANKFTNIVAVWNYNTGTGDIYVNGALATSGSYSDNAMAFTTYTLGDWSTIYYGGQMANVQIYNTSLSANDIKSLYYEGIGGAPQNTQNLVGWWPLNGNANDYSGNNNNGAAVNVVYTGSWEEGYSQP